MRLAEHYSHLNGLEWLQQHQPGLWAEIQQVVGSVDAEEQRTKASQERDRRGRMLFAPKALNAAFKSGFAAHGWSSRRTDYWVTSDARLIRRTLRLPQEAQRQEIESSGARAIRSYNQTDFVKERVAVEVQFGKYAFVAYDLFVKHLAFYIGEVIELGVEIVPMKEMAEQMSSGIAYYEGELYNLIREGRGVPPVPLLLLGVAP